MKPIQRSFAGAGVATTKAYIYTTHDDTEEYGAQWDVAYQTGIYALEVAFDLCRDLRH
jgi:hypothetical protein